MTRLSSTAKDLERRVVEQIRSFGFVTTEFIISSALKEPRKMVQGALKRLIRAGVVEEVRAGVNQSRCYRLVEKS